MASIFDHVDVTNKDFLTKNAGQYLEDKLGGKTYLVDTSGLKEVAGMPVNTKPGQYITFDLTSGLVDKEMQAKGSFLNSEGFKYFNPTANEAAKMATNNFGMGNQPDFRPRAEGEDMNSYLAAKLAAGNTDIKLGLSNEELAKANTANKAANQPTWQTSAPNSVAQAGAVQKMLYKNSAGATIDPTKYTNLQGADLENWAKSQGLTAVGDNYQPPNQDEGVARNLKAEQDFVKNWGGKNGRLPTANEINQAVYGNPNPKFNTPQGVTPNSADQGAAVKMALASDSGASGAPAPSTTPAPAATTPQEQITALEKAVADAMNKTQAETDTETLLNNLYSSEEMGLNKIKDQPIAMDFITGQSAALKRVADASANTLTRKLATEQARRAAALDVAKFNLNREDKKISAKAAAEKPVALSSGTSLVNPVTGKVIAQGEPSDVKNLLSKGYTYVQDIPTRDTYQKQGRTLVKATDGKTYVAPTKTIKTAKGGYDIVDSVTNQKIGNQTGSGNGNPVTPTTPKFDVAANEKKVNTYFATVKGSDNKVSPESYNNAKSAWIADGGNPTTFDTKFKGWRNPNNPYYGVTKTSSSSRSL